MDKQENRIDLDLKSILGPKVKTTEIHNLKLITKWM